jgi:hypothetical protein
MAARNPIVVQSSRGSQGSDTQRGVTISGSGAGGAHQNDEMEMSLYTKVCSFCRNRGKTNRSKVPSFYLF